MLAEPLSGIKVCVRHRSSMKADCAACWANAALQQKQLTGLYVQDKQHLRLLKHNKHEAHLPFCYSCSLIYIFIQLLQLKTGDW